MTRGRLVGLPTPRRASAAARRSRAASHAPSSSAAQSCSAPPNGTSTGASGAWQHGLALARHQHRHVALRVAAAPSRRPRAARRSPSSGRRPSTISRSTSSLFASRARSAPGSADTNATPRAAIPLSTRSSRANVTSSVAAREQLVLALQPAAHAGAPRRSHEPRHDQLARRLRQGERLGQRSQLRQRGAPPAARAGSTAPAPAARGTPRSTRAARRRAPPRPARRTRSPGRAAPAAVPP